MDGGSQCGSAVHFLNVVKKRRCPSCGIAYRSDIAYQRAANLQVKCPRCGEVPLVKFQLLN